MAYIFPNADVVSPRILSTQKQLNPPMCLLVGHCILLAIIRGGLKSSMDEEDKAAFVAVDARGLGP